MEPAPDVRDQLVAFFKALADVNRLKIVGLLAQRPYSGEELAALLHLKPPTVTHHLHRLSNAGLVSSRGESYYNVYRLEERALEQQARRLLSRQDFAAAVGDMDVEAYDRKVVADFSRPDGSLKTIPAQKKKREAILRHVVKAFTPGRRYSEKQANDLLLRFHADTATLRRELVGFGLMQRQGGGGDYWRTEPSR